MRNLISVMLAVITLTVPASAQTASASQSARTALGARVTDTRGIEVNDRRVNNRIGNRVSNRLSTRIQRYSQVQDDPTASLRTGSTETDRNATTRSALILTPGPVISSAYDGRQAQPM
jgi:hypothetical protein